MYVNTPYIIRTAIRQTFSGQPDNILKPIRDLIKATDCDSFPLQLIIDKLKKEHVNKSISFENDSDFNVVTDLKYGKPVTYLVLALLAEGRNPNNIYHQDHVFAQSLFNSRNIDKLNLSSEDKQKFEDKKNTLANIQLLQGNDNQSKSDKDFKTWLNERYADDVQRKAFFVSQHIPSDHSLEFADFIEFIEKREALIIESIKKLL
ncbi:DUF1524 domain-containing protein [Acinetobacter sp. c1-l78]